MWLMINEAILTKSNLLRRNWNGDPTCFFCKCTENISHFSFSVLLLSSFGQWSLSVLEQQIVPEIYNNVGNGVKCGYLLVRNTMFGVWQQYAGPYGRGGAKQALRRLSKKSYLSCMPYLCSNDILDTSICWNGSGATHQRHQHYAPCGWRT